MINSMVAPTNNYNVLDPIKENQLITRLVDIDEKKEVFKKEKAEMSFNFIQYLDKWLNTVVSNQTRRMYEQTVMRFASYFGYRVLSINADSVDTYVSYLKDCGYRGTTITTYMNSISSFYDYLLRHEKINRNYFLKSKTGIKPIPKDKYIPSEEEITLVMKEVSHMKNKFIANKVVMAIQIMRDYGVRVGFFTGMKYVGDTLVSFNKGKSYYVVLKEQDVVLYRANEVDLEGMNSNTISAYFNKAVNSLYESGKIEHKFSPHCLRHYFACKYYEDHKGEEVLLPLSRLLHHENVKTTQIYLRELKLID